MRIICKRPSVNDENRLGVCAYDVLSFRHHPADADSTLVCAMSNGEQLTITRAGADTDGTLGRIIQDLLGPTGVADCRDVPEISFQIFSSTRNVWIQNEEVPVMIQNAWAQATEYINYGRYTEHWLKVSTG